jgi:hypothetical protein
VRHLQVTTDDGAVPLWEQVHDGNTTDVATVIETMEALREHARCQDFVLVGDSKLLSAGNRRALLAAAVGYLAPLPRTAELDDAFLAILGEEWRPLAYVSAHERRKSPAARASYQGAERTVTLTLPDGAAGDRCYQLRRLFIVSSEERAACRRNRARQRERAEAEIARVVARVGSRWYPTAERARAKIEAILEQRHLRGLYRVTDEEQGGIRRYAARWCRRRWRAPRRWTATTSWRPPGPLPRPMPARCWPSGRASGRSSTGTATTRGRCASGRCSSPATGALSACC